MPRLLFLVPHPQEDAGYRYRVQQFLPYLENAGYQCWVWPFSTNQLYGDLRTRGRYTRKTLHFLYCTGRRLAQLADLSRFDMVVIQREVFPFLTPALERWVLFRHPRIVFAFDDAVYSGQLHAPDLNHAALYRFKYGRGVDEVIRRSSHVIAGNRILAEYARQLNPRVSIVPTVVDCGRYRRKPASASGPVTIGWMGSRSTAAHLRAIEPALKKVAADNPGSVRFRFFGFPEYQPDLPDCLSLPFRLETELEDLAGIDIGLMPLPDTEWTRGKCAFKAIQYMAIGAATVASPVGITTDLIQHGVNGMLASSEEEWCLCLNALLQHEELRGTLASAARRTIEESYSLQVWGPRVVTLFEEMSRRQETMESNEVLAADF
jgi:glycosyltransferase involved in cell wall biosynthesis